MDSGIDVVWSGPIPKDRVLRWEFPPGKYRIDTANSSCGKRFDLMGAPEEMIHVQL